MKKPSGREIKNLVYILLEYVTGGLLFDLCQTIGGMGEEDGRFFLHQMCDVLSYIQGKGVVHRDLKLENILVDENMNLKVADFGFATYKRIQKLNSYRGTMTYMAPEIKEGKTYDGRQIDIFSTGVILFIIVQGIFPFKEAKKDEYFYNLILSGKLDHYWSKVGGSGLSKDFKDLILKMFSYDPSKRPTVDQIKQHPWMQKPIDLKKVRHSIMDKLHEIRSAKTADSSRESASSRGDPMLELVRDMSVLGLERYRFNDQTDFDVDCEPGVVWDELNSFNEDLFEGRLKIEAHPEKQHLTLALEDKASAPLLVKVKFYGLEAGEEESRRLRIRFTKKRGDLAQWYEIFKQMQETQLEGLLLAPRLHQEEALTE